MLANLMLTVFKLKMPNAERFDAFFWILRLFKNIEKEKHKKTVDR